jgi:hypothetical protein
MTTSRNQKRGFSSRAQSQRESARERERQSVTRPRTLAIAIIFYIASTAVRRAAEEPQNRRRTSTQWRAHVRAAVHGAEDVPRLAVVETLETRVEGTPRIA